MPVLNIEGRRVRVGDEFLRLSPDEQSDAVDEIAASLGIKPSARDDYGKPPEGVVIHGADGRDRVMGADGKTAAEATRLVSGIGTADDERTAALTGTILKDRAAGKAGFGEIGRAILPPTQGVSLKGSDEIVSTIAGAENALKGGRFRDGFERMQEVQRQELQREYDEHPIRSALTEFGGAIATAPFLPAAQGIRAGAALGAGYGAVTGFLGGDGLGDRLSGAATGGAVGGALGGAFGRLGAGKPPPMLPPGGASTADIVAAGERLGVDVPRFVASDSKPVQMAAAVGRQSPFSGRNITNAAERFTADLGRAADDVASSVGSGSVLGGGEAARSGLVDFMTEGTKARSRVLYDSVDALVSSDVKTVLGDTQSAVAKIIADRHSAAMPAFGKAVDTVAEAISRPGGMTYQGIKRLRSSVGEMLKSGSILPEGMSKGELKTIYGALTTDLEKAAANGGGLAAERAFQRANSFYAAAQARNRVLAKIVGKDGDEAGEKVFDRIAAMAMSGAKADVRSLWAAKRSMPVSDWSEMTSGLIAKMGRAGPDAEFSAAGFATAWQKMSAEGKNALFGSSGALRQSLDDIATLATKSKRAAQFGSSGNQGLGGTLHTVGLMSAAVANPVAAALAVLGGEVMTRALSRPVTARSVANWAKTYEIAVSKPTAASAKAMRFASQRLGGTIARELDMPASAAEFSAGLYAGYANAGGDEKRGR